MMSENGGVRTNDFGTMRRRSCLITHSHSHFHPPPPPAAVEVPPGGTLLDAARSLGIDVPTLCYLEGCQPSTSCLVCVVRVKGRNGFVPACATMADDGMEVESESPEVHQVRKTALELLLSDHVGDCLAPCYFTCPAHMDIPLMLRQIGGENLREAIATVKEAIALPAVLGRICPGPCEKGCRRGAADGAVAVCGLKRFVADADLASREPLPSRLPAAVGQAGGDRRGGADRAFRRVLSPPRRDTR